MSPGRGGARRRRAAGICAVAMAASCTVVDVAPGPNPVPYVEALDPPSVTRGGEGTTVHVVGTGFVEGAEALWNGEPRPTTYDGEGLLDVALAPGDLGSASGFVSVRNPGPGGGTSAPVTLVVAHPAPTLSTLSPTTAPAVVTEELTLDVSGADFVTAAPGTRVLWDGVVLETEVLGPTELRAAVPDYLLRNGRTVTITAANPEPSAGPSNALGFAVQNPTPTLTGARPAGLAADAPSRVSFSGTGFVQGSVVDIEGMRLVPVTVSGSRLTVDVPAALAVSGSTRAVRVENPSPGGGPSNSLTLDVWDAPPRIEEVYPGRLFRTSDDASVLIVGSGFDPAATVTLNGTPVSPVTRSSTRIELSIAAADLPLGHLLELGVENPGGTGEAFAELETSPLEDAGPTLISTTFNNGVLVFSDEDGSEVQQVPIDFGYAVDASPTGTRVIYRADGIREWDADVGRSRSLASHIGPSYFLDWPRYSSDERWVYFMAEWTTWQLWRVPLAGGPGERLLPDVPDDLGYPSPSHRGDRVVYSVGISPSQSSSRLWILDVVTGASTPLDVRGYTSRWTPDDAWIVYWNGGSLGAVRPDGSDNHLLTNGPDLRSGFDISPDGRYIIAAWENRGGVVKIAFPSGEMEAVPGLDDTEAVAWFGP